MKKYISIFIILAIIIGILWYSTSHTTPLNIGGTSQSVNTAMYACNAGKTVTADFSEKAGVLGDQPERSASVKLSDGRTMSLKQTISADGVRYANEDESFIFWSKGNGALVLEDNKEKSYIGCILVAPVSKGSNLSQVYSNSEEGFSIRLPSLVDSATSSNDDSYKLDESYKNQITPSKTISGVKFTIPASMAKGTNLGSDSYIAVESIPQASSCTADDFFDGVHDSREIVENGTTYSIAASSGAGAGNRYEETVYAIPGTNPCMAIRYLIHYSVFENYPAGTVKEFDKEALTKEFDLIRQTLVINQ